MMTAKLSFYLFNIRRASVPLMVLRLLILDTVTKSQYFVFSGLWCDLCEDDLTSTIK